MTAQKISDKNKKLIMAGGITVMLLLFGGLYFLTIAKNSNTRKENKEESAFNNQLPTANLPKGEKNKLELYIDAQKDSIKKLQQEQTDPYIKRFFNQQSADSVNGNAAVTSDLPNLSTTRQPDKNEQRVTQRLEQLTQLMNQHNEGPRYTGTSAGSSADYGENDSAIAYLERRLTDAGSKTNDDKELDQINGLLDKILDVQNPERVKQKQEQAGEGSRSPYYAVRSTPASQIDTLLEYRLPGEEGVTNSFYTLHQVVDTSKTQFPAIRAVVHQTQTLQAGSTIKLRLLQSIFINNTEIPKDQFVFGKCAIQDERLVIRLDKLIYNNEIYPVRLSVYDGIDGQLGLNVPGAVTRDAAKENADRAIQSMSLGTLDPSLSAQAASAGIQTAKSMLSRKVKTVKVIAKAGDVLLLKNDESFSKF